MNAPVVRLTSLAHGGGCGCKLAPSVLRQLMANQPVAHPYANLLVGTETGDDAAVYRLEDGTCIIATTDFFMPMVDDPFDFGRIAATNAISDVYAMGGTPIMALAVLGMPVDKIAPETVRLILDGGRAICAEAGIPVAGGHSIDCPEPVYGLAVIGTCREENIRRNSEAKPGDALIFTKAIGVGIYSSAVKKNLLSPENYVEMVGSMTKLNRIGAKLAKDPDVHAMTDVTGFGLAGHALEMAQGSGRLDRHRRECGRLSRRRGGARAEGMRDGRLASQLVELWREYRHARGLAGMAPASAHRSADIGGLLIACAPEKAQEICAMIVAEGYPAARIVGRVEKGAPRVSFMG